MTVLSDTQEFNTVEELPDEYELISDSQDIKAVLESIGKREYVHEAGCLFTVPGDDEYLSVYYCESATPYTWKPVWKLK